MKPIPIYIGWDDKETVAYHTLAHSIIRRSSVPVSIIPLNRRNLHGDFWRPRGEHDSTDFSNSRFIVPYLQRYEGWAIFMDCDMLCLGDITELWAQRDDAYSVMVKKHHHIPKEDTKFLGQEQSKYSRKNWSSLMLFNCSRCQPLTRHIVNTMTPGLWFHQLRWTPDNEIGEIREGWNHLVGYDTPNPSADLPHFTSGGPWHGYTDVEFAQEWIDEYHHMIEGNNPVDWIKGATDATEKPRQRASGE